MALNPAAENPEKTKGWGAVGRSLGNPKFGFMLALGFSSGLPFMLVGNTLGFWLREAGITLTTIGFLSWVGLAYSLKFIWAPLVDKMPFPILCRKLGQRRGWMLASQVVVMGALLAMSYFTPGSGIAFFTGLALLAAIASATQDIVVDAWRIESSDAGDEMAMLSSAYQLGYRASLLVTDALILIVAGQLGWSVSYAVMGASMIIGIAATLTVTEPVVKKIIRTVPEGLVNLRGIFDAIFGPLIAFFKDHGKKALLILAAVSLYRLADFVMGPMANPFYNDLGITKEVVGGIRGSVGLIASIAGITAGGISAVRFGLVKTLLFGAFIGPASNLAFSALAVLGPSTNMFAAAMAIDNFANGFAGVALVGYMSSLTSLGYTATQYALLSSFYTLFGKLLKGFSGATVDLLAISHSQMDAYALFFAGTAVIGLPALFLCMFLVNADLKTK